MSTPHGVTLYMYYYLLRRQEHKGSYLINIIKSSTFNLSHISLSNSSLTGYDSCYILN